MTQVIDHNLGYEIVHNPGYDFDLGYKIKSEFFITQVFKSVTCVGLCIRGTIPLMHNLYRLIKK